MSLLYYKSAVLANPRALGIRHNAYGSIASKAFSEGAFCGIHRRHRSILKLTAAILTTLCTLYQKVKKRSVLQYSCSIKGINFLPFAQYFYAISCGGSISLMGLRATMDNPSMSSLYCSLFICMASSVVLGQLKDPTSRRLYKSRNPSPSQRRPLIRSERDPQKRKSTFFS